MHDPIIGKTLRWSFDDGPTAGKIFEHTFAADGTVRWKMVGGGKSGGGEALYQVARINDDVCAVSYLSESGYTLTSVLDLDEGTVVGFASNETGLVIQHGHFH